MVELACPEEEGRHDVPSEACGEIQRTSHRSDDEDPSQRLDPRRRVVPLTDHGWKEQEKRRGGEKEE